MIQHSKYQSITTTVAAFFLLLLGVQEAISQTMKVPPELEPWKDWVNETIVHRECPRVFNNHGQAVCYWPSQLKLRAEVEGAIWQQEVSVFQKSWIPIPGHSGQWPVEVRVDGKPAVVLERDGRPAVELDAGEHQLNGEFRWSQMPQKLKIPAGTGILDLTVSGQSRPFTVWSSNGDIWLRRAQGTPQTVDRLGTQVYRVIEDGIPVWLRTELELVVSGKSREEELGSILPEGWSVASVESPIPVAIDESGRMKAQVRAGKWSIRVNAFSTSDPGQIRFADSADPIDDQELVGLQQDTNFRVSYLEGLASVDVSQTTFPSRWRGVPVYQWNTATSLVLKEKQRGMGEKGQEGLRINRVLWIDDEGEAFTYEDKLKGKLQQVWRLDADQSVELGSIRINGESQLITKSPQGESSGVELRQRDIDLTAIGRGDWTGKIQATGWQADAEALSLTLTLPPGWRVLAVFGADEVRGDWMTTWSLLDLFLLMIFSLAVARLYGWLPGLLALVAFGLSYHEYGSPRWTWFCLLVPLALEKVVRSEKGKVWLKRVRLLAALLLSSFLIPFAAHQLQSVLYPQLEVSGVTYGYRDFLTWMGDAPQSAGVSSAGSYQQVLPKSVVGEKSLRDASPQNGLESSANMLFDPKSKIQTGPAKPSWSWNQVVCTWNGPVTARDQIQPIMLSLAENRILTLVRVGLLVTLALLFLSGGLKTIFPVPRRKAATVTAALLALLVVNNASGQEAPIKQPTTVGEQTQIEGEQELIDTAPTSPQVNSFPSQQLLDELRDRLNRVPSAYPNAAELDTIDLELKSTQLSMVLTYHAADRVAVPIPGRFPDWSPISVMVNDETSAVVTRKDDYLWVLLPAGIHTVTVKGQLAEQGNWELSFKLEPKRVNIDAPDWTVSGLSVDGVPQQALLFTQNQPSNKENAAYEQVRSDPIVLVDRQLEIGLVSRVRTVVTRIGSTSQALAIQVPLIAGESVLTPNREVNGDLIFVQMGAQQDRFEWTSELQYSETFKLSASESSQFVERWSLMTSPIWNVVIDGLQPVFEPDREALIPLWRPWGGESIRFTLRRPIEVVGESITINRINHVVNLGVRQRVTKLEIQLECSLSTDLPFDLDADSLITSITMDGNELPQQRDGTKLLVPISPGSHQLILEWTRNELLSSRMNGEVFGLSVEASNVTSTVRVPANRWVLWVKGPLRGPAVRFWTILMIAVLLSVILGGMPLSPLKRWEWGLLTIGLTQVHFSAAMLVVGWLFALEYRGRPSNGELGSIRFNLRQCGLVALTLLALIVLVFAVAAGLLGYPDMFISGNGSMRTNLHWFTPRAGNTLPTPSVITVSVWVYRVLMLCWALWLASALLRWLTRGWEHFTYGGAWKAFKNHQAAAGQVSVDGQATNGFVEDQPIDAELIDGRLRERDSSEGGEDDE